MLLLPMCSLHTFLPGRGLEHCTQAPSGRLREEDPGRAIAASWSRTHIFSVNFSQAYVHIQIRLLLKAAKSSFAMQAGKNAVNHKIKAMLPGLGRISHARRMSLPPLLNNARLKHSVAQSGLSIIASTEILLDCTRLLPCSS